MFSFLPQTLISMLIVVVCAVGPCGWLFHLPIPSILGPVSTHSHPESPPRGMGDRTSDVTRWTPLVETHFGDLGLIAVDTALCLIALESGGNPDAKNPNSSAHGLMQILASLWAPEFGITYEDLYDPETNLWAARKVYDIQGWEAWSPYKRGNCH